MQKPQMKEEGKLHCYLTKNSEILFLIVMYVLANNLYVC